MISKNSLQQEWIQQISKSNRKADPILVEKVIRALLLLEGLVEANINFIFKGGTALMLLLDSKKRLSIDIDIIMPEKMSDLEQKLETIVAQKGFSKMEIQERVITSNIHKNHFKFYYTPVYFGGRTADVILLDILFEKNQYQKIKAVDINSSFVIQEGQPLQTQIPSFEDLLGDKLTAFAPETTGIPYQRGGFSKTMEINKQLFDIGHLFDCAENLPRVAATFQIFASTELKYRNIEKNPDLVLEDIFQTALTISTKGKEGKADFRALQDGIFRLKPFIFFESYHIEKAIIHASKAAYLAKLIQFKKQDFERFNNTLALNDYWIEQPFYTKLNKLKKSNPEAFFYWFKTWELMKV